MNLKDAFRYQNKLSDILRTAQTFLATANYVTQIKDIHLRSKVDPTATDEVQYPQTTDDSLRTIVSSRRRQQAFDDDFDDDFDRDMAPEITLPPANVMIDFLLDVLDIKAQLTAAIHQAKKQQPFDLDGASALNTQRQEAARSLRALTNRHSFEKIIPGGGTGYRFNQEGNQITYRCDLKRVSTINYDRQKVRQAAARLSQTADEVSAQIDRCLIDTTVAFEPPFDVNATFAEILEDYAAKHQN